MLRFHVKNELQHLQLEHEAGPLEFGRGPKSKEVPRCTIQDLAVSRDQMRVEELAGGRVRVENLSQRNPIDLADGDTVTVGARRELKVPVQLSVGATVITILPAMPSRAGFLET